jgi:hypothetical protein
MTMEMTGMTMEMTAMAMEIAGDDDGNWHRWQRKLREYVQSAGNRISSFGVFRAGESGF